MNAISPSTLTFIHPTISGIGDKRKMTQVFTAIAKMNHAYSSQISSLLRALINDWCSRCPLDGTAALKKYGYKAERIARVSKPRIVVKKGTKTRPPSYKNRPLWDASTHALTTETERVYLKQRIKELKKEISDWTANWNAKTPVEQYKDVDEGKKSCKEIYQRLYQSTNKFSTGLTHRTKLFGTYLMRYCEKNKKEVREYKKLIPHFKNELRSPTNLQGMAAVMDPRFVILNMDRPESKFDTSDLIKGMVVNVETRWSENYSKAEYNKNAFSSNIEELQMSNFFDTLSIKGSKEEKDESDEPMTGQT